MKTLRQTLMASHIAAIAIAVLIFDSIGMFFTAFLGLLPVVSLFVATAIASRGMPATPRGMDLVPQFGLFQAFYGLCISVFSLVGAWLLSRWVYGSGPLSVLSKYRQVLKRRHHA